jgi:UDP-N-acetylglucosamine 2-epimerase
VLKVMTIVGTRPEVIRLSRVIDKLDRHCNHLLVHTGQNHDAQLSQVFFSELGIRKPDHFLDAAGANPAQTIGQIIMAVDALLDQHRPEAVLILGDTNSALAAIPAKRRQIPIFHMEAGNRCFDFRVPEEINRRIVDHVADINLTYSEIGRSYLLREGLPPDQVIKTGSPMREVIEHHRAAIDGSDVLQRLSLVPRGYFIVSAHREENVDSPQRLSLLLTLLDGLARQSGLPVIVSTHPRTRKRLDAMEFTPPENVLFHAPFGFPDYVKLQIEARVVLSDSGTLTEESSILNFPALNLREVHERPEGFDEAAVMMVGLSLERVLQCLPIVEAQPRGGERLLALVEDYAPINVSDKVLRIIMSYTDFVARKTWHRN